MDTKEIIAQSFGILAMGIALLSYQQKTQKKIVLFQSVSSFIFGVHFLLLPAITGSLLNFFGCFRAIIYSKRGQKWADHPAWLVLFILMPFILYAMSFLFFGIEPTIGNFLRELLPTLGMVATTISFRMKKAAQVRLFSLISSPLWLVYNCAPFTLGGVLTESFSLLSILIGILRLDLKKNKE